MSMVAHRHADLKVDVPEGVSGEWLVRRVTVSEEDEMSARLRCALKPQRPARYVPAGTYTQLKRGLLTIVMSDTPDEIDDFREPLNKAKGRCLINGLGLGVVANAMLMKPEVEHLTVIELSEDVIKLVGPWLVDKHGDRVNIIHADAFMWKPPKGAFYDVVWHDIWDDISEDNLDEMKRLKLRYGRCCGWQGCWAQEHCRAQRDRVRNGRGWY